MDATTGADGNSFYSPVAWKKASRCSSGMCVEVARWTDGTFAIRDSKNVELDASDDIIELSEADFLAFQKDVLTSEYGECGEAVLIYRSRKGWIFRCNRTGVELWFTQAEVAAFRDGVRRGEFLLQSV